jgi:signal peptidase I
MKIIKILKCFYVCILFVIAVCLLTFILVSNFNKNKYFELFGYSFFEVQSYSMYPELTKGDLIVVKKRDSSEYEVGMTVTYLRPTDTMTTTHKIVGIDGNLVTTKGINEETNKDCDLPIEKEYIIGEVIGIWTGFNNVKQFVTHPIGIIIIILSGFLFIEALDYLEVKCSKSKNSRKEQE